MRFEEIETVLGVSAVRGVVNSVCSAIEPGSIAAGEPQQREALEALLVAMLAAVIITPKEGAMRRVDTAMESLGQIVTTSLGIGAQDFPRGASTDCGTGPHVSDPAGATYL